MLTGTASSLATRVVRAGPYRLSRLVSLPRSAREERCSRVNWYLWWFCSLLTGHAVSFGQGWSQVALLVWLFQGSFEMRIRARERKAFSPQAGDLSVGAVSGEIAVVDGWGGAFCQLRSCSADRGGRRTA